MGREPEEKSLVKAKFSRDLATVREDLMELAGLAAAAMEQSVRAVLTRDGDLARRVIAGDAAINSLEEAIDRECVRLIALFQPVAGDLRQLMAVDHIITELERIGDSATNIAEEVLTLGHLPPRAIHPSLASMAQSVQEMVRQSLEAFSRSNSHLARQVCLADDDVDAMDRAIIQDLLREMTGAPRAIVPSQSQINIVRNLERVGDHATNIAEQVVYMVEGQSVRHRCQG
ncbi:MAG: phosphate transport system regulatory protein PhoU [Deltaproteobacteria bacterium CG07_land_8_20_14_0_80_60_11]|nr:MAG: phosphate transport system regulatory protein PhoU [Deltaproteobacteria bacterium CG07_land_8_20_14_0_80_60_11]